jgi:hypothetical protein
MEGYSACMILNTRSVIIVGSPTNKFCHTSSHTPETLVSPSSASTDLSANLYIIVLYSAHMYKSG